ncbi:TonB-dependent receptor [Winogradskyella sp.]|jgi:outer membrane receptor protein involved in Fe transport|uniref:TonB-dependent receptor n=1 Tax=Winogradskyella sp. TaxID=1883156 RepID=UPI0025F9852D|nr:TonB-dependent receptor [Winogradskyella sp.]MCT4629208.1 TonB-dependent receptor [Winogradskyella sp.]
MKTILKLFTMLFCVASFAQTTIKGKITEDSGLPLPGANIVVVGTTSGTVSDFDGNYTLIVDQDPPFSIRISYAGFEAQTIEITSKNQTVDVTLKEGNSLDEVVISASRTPERIFESPVTVERFGIKEIKNTASLDFYDGLENLKGVDINTNSLTFKSINTRGFATFANTRFMQLVDGMDNSAPALNFPLGNLLGMTETDVQSVELLPGAASALYGANAFNGILFMRSKNPFDHQGISGFVKRGITSQEAAGDNDYTDLGIRMAYKFSEKFAAKVNFGYLKGTDWYAVNEQDKLNRGLTRADIDYDGINVYGDEVSTNINGVAQLLEGLGLAPAGSSALVPSVDVSRTGYNERDLTNYNAESIKADWGLYFRPWENDFEIQYVGKVGSGNTIYQGANRYNIKNFFLQQHKLEIRNDNFFVRGYITEDKAGDSYDMVFTGININRAWKDDQTWFGEYVASYIGATLGGATNTDAHAAARQAADTGRYLPGTPEFQAAFNRSVNDPDLSTGSKFQDNSRIYHADANYNLGDLVDFAEIQLGGSYRRYRLNSSGTIYTDNDGPINYSEVGIYTQLQRSLELSEAVELKLTGSIRYDKSELFDGFISPRLSAGFTINKNHNIRASFQTGFRNPTTQDLYIGLDVGRAILIGGASDNLVRDVRNYDLSATGTTILGQSNIDFDGSGAYNNSFLASSVTDGFAISGNPADLEIGNSNLVKPEQVSSVEVGYRGKLDGIIVDASAYFNHYQDFLANETVIAPFYGDVQLTETLPDGTPLAVAAIANGDFQAYQTYTNSNEDVNSYGAAIQVSAKVFNGFDLSANYTYSKLDFDVKKNPDFRTNFNTPEHKVKASFGKTELFKNFGFNVSWRWSDNYFWEASFGDGDVPSFNVLDAQVNFRIPSLKSTFKAGATNLLQDEYFTAFGTGFIGSQYYVSWTINNL